MNDLVNFDAEGMMTYVSNESAMESEYDAGDDYDYYEDDNEMDEKCWKVRRATLHYVTFLVKKDKAFR